MGYCSSRTEIEKMPDSENLNPAEVPALQMSISNNPVAAAAPGGVSRLNKEGECEQSER